MVLYFGTWQDEPEKQHGHFIVIQSAVYQSKYHRILNKKWQWNEATSNKDKQIMGCFNEEMHTENR